MARRLRYPGIAKRDFGGIVAEKMNQADWLSGGIAEEALAVGNQVV